MALVDSLVGACFRNEEAGRVVVYPGDRRNRGYVVKSDADEKKIRSFLKMFFFAHLSILLLGYFLGAAWSLDLNHALGRPAASPLRSLGVSAGIYLLVAGVPYLLLWRSYKKAFASFVAGEVEVVVTERGPGRKRRIVIGAALVALAILLMIGAMLLVRAK
jgi:hypothetical protein